jgi:hypothetical protein
MMATAFFLGMKSAQLDVSLDLMKSIFAFIKDFNKESKISNDQLLLKYEFYLIHIINYDFYVFCPYKAMMGFIYKLQSSDLILKKLKNATAENLSLKEIEAEAEKFIDRTFASDAVFMFNYSIIALSCIIFAVELFNQSKNIGISPLEILEALEVTDLLDVDNFLNVSNSKIYDFISKVPNFTREEIREKKSRTTGFLIKYKEYNEKLEVDRR